MMYNLRSGLWSVTTVNCIHVIFKSFTREYHNTSLSVWEYLVSVSDNERLAKASGCKKLFAGVFLKQNNTKTLLAGVSKNFDFKRQMKIWQDWSLEMKVLILLKLHSGSPFHIKSAFWCANCFTGSVIAAKFGPKLLQ